MANKKNLMPIQEVNSRRTRQQHSMDSRKAGIASGKKRKEQKLLRESMQTILDMKIDDSAIEMIQGIVQTEFKNMDAQTAMSIALFKKAMMGDVQAYNAIRDILGQKPVDKVQDVTESKEVVIIHDINE